ncbi:pvadh, partial [Mucuna pruriens]
MQVSLKYVPQIDIYLGNCHTISTLNSISPPKYTMHLSFSLLFFCVHAVIIFAAISDGLGQQSQDWLNHGGDLFNRRYAYKERKISPKTAPSLRLKWEFYAGKDISATPAIYDGNLYFPSWNGNIYAVKEVDGSLVWKQNLQNLTGLSATGRVRNVNWTVSRSTPTVAGNDLMIIGIYGPAVVIAVKSTTGELVWKTTLDHHPAAVITMSGTYYKGGFYVGISSLEVLEPVAECCEFRGSFVKLDARTGAISWKTFMLPDNNNTRGEYAGAAIWGSSPSIDAKRNHVYIGTGNLYSAPLRIRQCRERQINRTRPTQPDECVEPENHSDSILALDLDSGKIIWYCQLGGYDVWFFACSVPSDPNCPPLGDFPDSDFGECPMMLTTYINRTKKDIVVAVQKNGYAWALDRNNGNIVWYTEAGPHGLAGGGSWGAATDERRVYTNIVNSNARNFTLKPSNTNTTAGGWVAMDANNGRVLWSTANPSNSFANGPVSVANEVVFAGSPDRMGSIYAIDAKSGEILWSYQTGASVYGGMSISNGCIYVGHGYNVALGPIFNFTSGTSLFAFCV